jgi:hypothetical protein
MFFKFQKHPLILLEDSTEKVAHHSELLDDIASVKFFIKSAEPAPEVQIVAVIFFFSQRLITHENPATAVRFKHTNSQMIEFSTIFAESFF